MARCDDHQTESINWRALMLWAAAAILLPPLCRAQLPKLPQLDKITQAVKPQYVEVESVAEYKTVGPGRRFHLAIALTITSPYHLYANPRQGEFGTDTQVVPPDMPGVEFGEPIYPPGHPYTDAFSNTNHVYDGTTVVYLPVTVTDASNPTLSVPLGLVGQLCSDDICIPWDDTTSVELAISTDPAAAFAETQQPELFTDLPELQRAAAAKEEAPPSPTAWYDWIKYPVIALLAGLVMNVMPCTLPVLPIIILTLVRQCAPAEGAAPDRAKSIRIGLAFAAGIMIVFLALAILVGGMKYVWGQWFTYNAFKFALLMIVYVLGLSMFGLFEITLPAGIANLSVQRQGYIGAALMGMLATVLATPCGAALLVGVTTWATTQPIVAVFIIFVLLGLGMALPYIILTAFPSLLGRIPKGGAWMERIKQVLGFMILAYSVYLITLLPSAWTGPLLYFCVLIAVCLYLAFTIIDFNTSKGRRLVARAIALAALIVGCIMLHGAIAKETSSPVSTSTAQIDWLQQLDEGLAQKKTVLVKYTANWCKNCSVLDKTIYKTDAFKQAFAETNAVLVIADWSQPDDTIKNEIERIGGGALPVAAVYHSGRRDAPTVLTGQYSIDELLDAVKR